VSIQRKKAFSFLGPLLPLSYLFSLKSL